MGCMPQFVADDAPLGFLDADQIAVWLARLAVLTPVVALLFAIRRVNASIRVAQQHRAHR
jgi:hypothetical protein